MEVNSDLSYHFEAVDSVPHSANYFIKSIYILPIDTIFLSLCSWGTDVTYYISEYFGFAASYFDQMQGKRTKSCQFEFHKKSKFSSYSLTATRRSLKNLVKWSLTGNCIWTCSPCYLTFQWFYSFCINS